MAKESFLVAKATLVVAALATLGLTASACGFATGPSPQEGLVGSWRWVESTGGIAGMTLTPESTGDSVTLRFTGDDRVQLFRNGELERAVGFGTTTARDGSLDILYAEPLMGFETQTATFPSVGELVLTDPCCDGFVSRYVRTQ